MTENSALCHQPAPGELVRIGSGTTSLMWFKYSVDHGVKGVRMPYHYGDHVMGGSVGAIRMYRPTEQDIKRFGAQKHGS